MTPGFKTAFAWLFRLVSAIIMLQTLFFEFTAAPESVFIFSELGMEPWGRIATGAMEFIASLLILIPRTTAVGALLALGVMTGAILSHLLFLGIQIQGDGGQLFIYALLVFISSLILLVWYRRQLFTLLAAGRGPANVV